MKRYIVTTLYWDVSGCAGESKHKEFKTKWRALRYFEKEEERVCQNHGWLVTLTTKKNNPEVAVIHKSSSYLD